MSKQITSWQCSGDNKSNSKYGFVTHTQWLLKEQERFREAGIHTVIRNNPENRTEEALFYLHKDDVPHVETPQERYSSIKNTYK